MGVGPWQCIVSAPTDGTTSHQTGLSKNDSQFIGNLAFPLERGCCRFSGFTPTGGKYLSEATTVYSLRVKRGGEFTAIEVIDE